MRGFVRLHTLWLLILLSPAWAQQDAVRWSPSTRFHGDIFPSFILANATRKSVQPPIAEVFGDRLGSVSVSVVNPRPRARVRVSVAIDGFAAETDIEAVLQQQGEEYIFIPPMRYDYQSLARAVQPTTTTIHYRVFVDGVQAGAESRAVRVRSVNDAPIATFDGDKQTGQYAYMFAAYVNESHPAIEYILRGALQLPQPIVRSFDGYAGDVMSQVFAVWYFLQRNGFAYTTIATPSGESAGVVSQHVRFIDDSIRVRQANCIDGTVLFASILRKIGIDPLIVLVPGHAFLGFYLDPQHKQVAFLETTQMTATNPFTNRVPSRLGTALARAVQFDPRMAQSASAFNYAVHYANEAWERARPALANRHPQFAAIDVAAFRRAGVQSIAR